MNLSSNSLYHFTDSLDVLKKILKDKFRGGYCKEIIHFKDEDYFMFVPKISFCDIPLKTLSNYSSYGKYGIGMKKEWGIKKGLNPVLYIERNSNLIDSLKDAIFGSINVMNNNFLIMDNISEKIKKLEAEEDLNSEKNDKEMMILKYEIDNSAEVLKSINYNIYSLYYIKHYEDELIRGGVSNPKYRFYDEREWCYIPKFDYLNSKIKKIENDEEYKEWRNKSDSKPLIEYLELDFCHDDIEHIIVKNHDDVIEIVNFIKGINGKKISKINKELLLTKITSFEKLECDY